MSRCWNVADPCRASSWQGCTTWWQVYICNCQRGRTHGKPSLQRLTFCNYLICQWTIGHHLYCLKQRLSTRYYQNNCKAAGQSASLWDSCFMKRSAPWQYVSQAKLQAYDNLPLVQYPGKAGPRLLTIFHFLTGALHSGWTRLHHVLSIYPGQTASLTGVTKLWVPLTSWIAWSAFMTH